MHNKIRAKLLPDDNFITAIKKSNEEIINSINSRNYDQAKELISQEIIYNDCINNNVFNILLNKIALNKQPIYTELLLLTLNNSSFIFSGENIRQCVRLLPESFHYHAQIFDKIKEQKVIENLSIKEKTDLLLMISEYFHHKTSDANYQKYIRLFSYSDKKNCQQYLIENFESYFTNCYSPIKTTEDISLTGKRLIKQVLVEQSYKEKKGSDLKTPSQDNVLLGEDVKYVNMLIVLWFFYKHQKKVKYGYACLLKNPSKFFIFFSQYIKPHYKCDNNEEIIKFLEEMQIKYNFASITWDNRYFYENSIDTIKNTMQTAFEKSLQFFKMNNFHSIHLQLRSSHNYQYNGQYWNPFTADIYKNTHLIIMEKQGLKDFETTWIHELTHFIHFQQKNEKCFKHQTFKKLKDTLYLHKERNYILNKLRNFLLIEDNQESEIITLFNNYLHSSIKVFNNKLDKLLTKGFYTKEQYEFFKSLFMEYKTYNYKDSRQYLIWKDCAKKHNMDTSYFNRNHEIHARLNEILSGKVRPLTYDTNYLTVSSVRFDVIKNDLIKFNALLAKRLR